MNVLGYMLTILLFWFITDPGGFGEHVRLFLEALR